MEGKPNRAGAPVRMLKSTEDTTPMKYKSVRKAGKENLMSALAKQGEPVKKKMINDFTTNLDSGTKIDLGPTPKKKAIPKKVKNKKKKGNTNSGDFKTRKVTVKF